MEEERVLHVKCQYFKMISLNLYIDDSDARFQLTDIAKIMKLGKN